MPAIEVLKARLLPGSDLNDPNGDAVKVIREGAETLLKQEGVTQVHFGTWIEDPSTLQIIVDWESLEKHQVFQNSEVHGPFVERIFSVTTGVQDTQLVHVDFKPLNDLKRALDAPLTSIATFAFENGQPQPDYESSAQKFFDIVKAGNVETMGDSFGLTFEAIEFGGVTGRCALLVAGWPDMEEYKRVHALPVFKDNLKFLVHGTAKRETHYMHLNKVERS